ncbi:MAG TPA: alginate lyase family protein [Usitatibacter sp.]
MIAPSPRSAMLYWNTVRHLKPVQIGARLLRAFPRSAPHDMQALPRRNHHGLGWVRAAERRRSMPAPMTFEFLNERRAVADTWDLAGASDLWLYNLHYFDDLNAEGNRARRPWHDEAISRWLAQNRPGRGPGWAPYPASLRIVNWIKMLCAGAVPVDGMLQSLVIQSEQVSRNLEYHLLGNHLLANAKALCFAGLFFEGAPASQWFERGAAILERELPEQILGDGGHFERSPMYQSLVLEDLLDLCNLFRSYEAALPRDRVVLAASVRTLAGRMRGWLDRMGHPDGEISFFNDAAMGIAPAPAEISRYADELGIGALEVGQALGCDDVSATSLQPSGYVRACADGADAIIDVAPVGPDYLPGHAHADTLSFELSLGRHRLIVNGGTSRYGRGPEREAERATASHSTVTIDGENSSEVWDGFRVARRAHPVDFSARVEGRAIVVSCAHDGYRRLPGSPLHRRSWRIEGRHLEIGDSIEGTYGEAVARYVLHPGVTCELEPDGMGARLKHPGGVANVRVSPGKLRLADAHYSPEFGRRLATSCLELPVIAGQGAIFDLRW